MSSDHQIECYQHLNAISNLNAPLHSDFETLHHDFLHGYSEQYL